VDAVHAALLPRRAPAWEAASGNRTLKPHGGSDDNQSGMKQAEHLSASRLDETPHGMRSALDSVRHTVTEASERLHAVERERNVQTERERNVQTERERNVQTERERNAQTERERNAQTERERATAEPAPPALLAEAATLRDEVAALRDELSALAADVVLLAADRPAPELRRQVSELAAQCTDLPTLRAVVTRLEQDLETRLQAPASALETTIDDLDAKVTQAMACISTASDAARLSSDAMLREARRLDAGMEARLQDAIEALDATRSQLQRHADRAVENANLALARTDELATRDELVARDLERLDARVTALIRELEPPVTLAEALTDALDGLRALVVTRLTGWLGWATRGAVRD